MTYPSNIINNKCLFCQGNLTLISLLFEFKCIQCKVIYIVDKENIKENIKKIEMFYFQTIKYEVWIYLNSGFVGKTKIFTNNSINTEVCSFNSIIKNLTPQNIENKILTLINFY